MNRFEASWTQLVFEGSESVASGQERVPHNPPTFASHKAAVSNQVVAKEDVKKGLRAEDA